MAGTTLVITLIEEVPSFIQISKQEFRPIWVRIIRLTKSRFIIYYHPDIREVPGAIPSPSALALETSKQPHDCPGCSPPSLRLQKDPAKLVIKAKELMGLKTKVRARRPSPSQMPKALPRPRKLQLRQRKQRPRLKKLILRPRTLQLR